MSKVGQLAVKLGYCTEEGLRRSLSEQTRLAQANGKKIHLLRVMVHLKVVTKEQAHDLQQRLSNNVPEKQSGSGIINTMSELSQRFTNIQFVDNALSNNQPYIEVSDKKKIIVVAQDDKGQLLIFHSDQKAYMNSLMKANEQVTRFWHETKGGRGTRPKLVPITQEVMDILASTLDETDAGDSSQQVKLFQDLIRKAVELKASDVHFFREEDVCHIRMRIYGAMRTYRDWGPDQAEAVLSAAFSTCKVGKSDTSWDPRIGQRVRIGVQYDKYTHIDGRYEHSPGDGDKFHACIRLQVNDIRDKYRVPRLTDLGYTKAQEKMLKAACRKQSGMVCFSGPTGSGKSTTMAAIIKWLYQGGDQNILTVESPVERDLPAFQAAVSDNEEAKANEFAEAVRSCLRRDPDVLMIGETRDKLSAEAVVSGVQTGHMLLTSIHAQSGIEIVERMASSALQVPRETIGSPSFISALVFQMLLPKLDDDSKIQLNQDNIYDYLDRDLVHRIMRVADITKANICIRGSSEAYPEGICGMTVCAEVITPDMKMREFFREMKLTEALTHWLKSGHHVEREKPLEERVIGFTAHDHAVKKMIEGMIDPRDVEDYFGLLSMQMVMEDGVFDEQEADELFDYQNQEPAHV